MEICAAGKSERLLSESRGEEQRKGFDRVFGTLAFGANPQTDTFFGGQHHQRHDGFCINFEVALGNVDLAREVVGRLHDLVRRPSVQPLAVYDFDFCGEGIQTSALWLRHDRAASAHKSERKAQECESCKEGRKPKRATNQLPASL